MKIVCVDEARVPARASDQPGIGSKHPVIFHMSIYTVNHGLCYDSSVMCGLATYPPHIP